MCGSFLGCAQPTAQPSSPHFLGQWRAYLRVLGQIPRKSPWGCQSGRAFRTQLAGFLVAGVSPRLRLNDQYRGFLDLVAAQFAASITTAQAYEQERKRAEALAEIDRVKTLFFSNVSHEFRTSTALFPTPTARSSWVGVLRTTDILPCAGERRAFRWYLLRTNGVRSRLIEQGLSQDLGGLVTRDFPNSVVCSIRAPLAEIGGT